MSNSQSGKMENLDAGFDVEALNKPEQDIQAILEAHGIFFQFGVIEILKNESVKRIRLAVEAAQKHAKEDAQEASKI